MPDVVKVGIEKENKRVLHNGYMLDFYQKQTDLILFLFNGFGGSA